MPAIVSLLSDFTAILFQATDWLTYVIMWTRSFFTHTTYFVLQADFYAITFYVRFPPIVRIYFVFCFIFQSRFVSITIAFSFTMILIAKFLIVTFSTIVFSKWVLFHCLIFSETIFAWRLHMNYQIFSCHFSHFLFLSKVID